MPKLRAGSLSGKVWAVAATAASPALRLLLRRRLGRGKEIPGRLAERRGIDPTPRPPGKLLWLHAASVGEAVSVLPVLLELPEQAVVLFTTGTATSARLLAERLPTLGLDHRVLHRFVPLDVPSWATRFLDHWQPDAACFLESELWPNLIAACRTRSIPLALINARMSQRSAAGWARLPGLAREMLGSFDFVAARSATDAARLTSLGAAHVTADGDLKLNGADLPFDEVEFARLQSLLGDRSRLLAASTHPGEEALIARLHHALAMETPGLLTAIVPRHPERGAQIAAELGAGLRSQGASPSSGLWVADTMGELGLFYRLFPAVLMGKSFMLPGGGQNPLEPARLGCSVAIGKLHDNFSDVVTLLQQAGTLEILADEAAALTWGRRMLAAPQRKAAAGLLGATPDLPAKLAARLAALIGVP